MGITTAAMMAGGASVVGGLLANDAANKGHDAIERANQEALNQYSNIKQPTYEDLKLLMENPQLMGEYAPELEQALLAGPSSMENVKASDDLKNKQMEALQSLAEIGKTGMTEADRSAFREMQRMNAQEAQAQQNAILSNMSQRGTLGSGAELAARMQASQNASNNLSRASDSLTKEAQNRALQAMLNTGNMAGQMRSQDVNEQENVARAKDAIAQFNLQNQQTIGSRNTGAKNQAQLQNLQNRQSLENARASNLNQQNMYNANARQQVYNNAMDMARIKAGIYSQQGTNANERAAGNSRAIGNIFNGITGTIASMDSVKKPTNSAPTTQDLQDYRSQFQNESDNELGWKGMK